MGLATLVIMSVSNLEKQALKGSVVVAHRLSCPATYGVFLDQGLNRVSCVALQGEFLTTGSRGKPQILSLLETENVPDLFHVNLFSPSPPY